MQEVTQPLTEHVYSSALRRGKFVDRLFEFATHFFALLVLAIVAGVLLLLAYGAMPAISKFGAHFLSGTDWNPVTGEFGALPAIYGTVITSVIAMLIGVPVCFGIALFITEMAPQWLRRPIGTAIELLAAIPSIIYGMWGLFVFVPLFAENVQPWLIDHLGNAPIVGMLFSGAPMGIGVFTAGLVLAIMVVPFIAAVMRDVFEIVPALHKESAYGLGATTWEVVWHIVLPYTKVGVIGGIMLGLGRALGETMAVTFVIGNAHSISASLFMPGSTISSVLANEFSEADTKLYTSSLVSLGLVLFLITFVVLAFAKVLLLRLTAREGKRT